MLRSIRYGEADRILHLYTPHRGRVGAIAKGVRRARSRFGGRLEPFFRLELVLHEGRGDLLRSPAPRPSTPTRACASTARARRRRARLRRRRAAVRHRRAASRRLPPALQRARAARRATPADADAAPTSSRSASSCCSPPAWRRSSPRCASCGEREHLARLLRRGRRRRLRAPARRRLPARRGGPRLPGRGARAPAGRGAAGRAERALRQAERAIAETVEHHAARPAARRRGADRIAAGMARRPPRRSGSTTSPRGRARCATCSAARAPTSPR